MPISLIVLSAGLMAVAPAAAASPAVSAASGSAHSGGFRPGGPLVRAAAAWHGRGPRATTFSTNWSGYAATGPAGAFRSVSASWVQPAVSCDSGTPRYASFWAGLDGYSSRTVEQIGTDSDCAGRTPVYYGWYEMFPTYPVFFTNPVQPGDRITASVTFSGGSLYTLVLRDQTQGWTRVVTQSRQGLRRSSAEVITEAPSSPSGVLPLANFGTVRYSGVTANGNSMGTMNPIRIIMVNNQGMTKSATSAISRQGAFSNTWVRSAARQAPAHSVRAGISGFSPGGTIIRTRAITHRGRRATAYSTNWSGYAVTGRSGTFRAVSASWTVPAVSCASRSSQYSSFWVGLDGYSSQSVEQTGTDSDCSGLTPQYYGWYEMYPAYPVYFLNTVRPGDRMSASVTFSGSTTYKLVLTNATRGWTRTVTQNRSGLARSSAEVITEAPSSFAGVLPLASFGTVRYSASAANGSPLGTLSPVQIIMVNRSGQAKDSTSGISSGGAFSNTWLRSA